MYLRIVLRIVRNGVVWKFYLLQWTLIFIFCSITNFRELITELWLLTSITILSPWSRLLADRHSFISSTRFKGFINVKYNYSTSLAISHYTSFSLLSPSIMHFVGTSSCHSSPLIQLEPQLPFNKSWPWLFW